ncbi:hypothetical protein CLHOM_27350 [Clostridium homopropionicum DSM 5847]|uniref:Uncharacterized protein n=1 Tax=Clostridium homopropionicum DSM 5847 TaxID=1121318 RepID=A0A0L6Z7Q0_9CLOT|nr:hypothetical protein [Clostridium homopropionicum]KOA18995.1 hypothetical protein CLHOM_27350 [Clostridium homopropionicum DSM 5847]SFG42273.1 hypothetical protein SAMN04488501_10918 [Clostridium homopropionicum]
MDIDIVKLEQFRDLKISREELYQSMHKDVAKISIETPVKVCSEHVIGLLEGYKNGLRTKDTILEWVNTIWFSGWFEYCDEQCDSIASVMNCLEEIDEEGKELNLEKVEIYLNALKHNLEVD